MDLHASGIRPEMVGKQDAFVVFAGAPDTQQ
jgi:hypothetical protein